MKEAYLLIRNRLQEITELGEVDWYTGQDLQNGDQEQIAMTSAYIAFAPMSWETLGLGLQRALVSFDVRLVQNSVQYGEGPIVDADLAHFELITSIFKKMQGWSGILHDLPGLSGLEGTKDDAVIVNEVRRVGMETQHELDNLHITIQTFESLMFDLSAMPQYDTVTANLQLDIQID